MKAPGTVDMLTALASLVLVASACASGAVRVGDSSGGAGSGATSGLVGGSVGSGGSGGGLSLTLPPPSSDSDGSATTASNDGQVVGCTDGDACACSTLNVAVVGTKGEWGDSSDTAFQSWLNASSTGTAKVDNYLTKPTLTPEFLAKYNLIILAGLGDNSNSGPWWTFSATEIAAFQDWIENKGGGVISLAGYSGDNQEISAKNDLLAFSGVSYDQPNISPPCAIAKCHYECGNPAGQITSFNRTDPVIANLSLGVTMIGMDGGHPIIAPADAHVAAFTTNATSVSNWLVGKITGKGRVLLFADEWITYTSQWDGQNPNNDPSCTNLLPQNLYQTSQFWYNMLHWTQPGATCFTIIDNTAPVPVTIW
jgi:hypothetical protein